MKEALIKLQEFCNNNKIEMVVTGSWALAMHGLPQVVPVNDIDIKVFHLTAAQRNKLKELEVLAGLDNPNYPGSDAYTFVVDGVKVNAIVDNTEDYDLILRDCCTMVVTSDNKPFTRCHIDVQHVGLALAAKMKLQRAKDKEYMLRFINFLTSL